MRLLKSKVKFASQGKSYAQACGVAKALDVVGERWTLLIVRDLLMGPRRYKDLLEDLDGLTTNLLAKRLKEMCERGLIEKAKLPPPASSAVYKLTDAGKLLEPTVLALAEFGSQVELPDDMKVNGNLRWLVLNLKRIYREVPTEIWVNFHLETKRLGNHEITIRTGGAGLYLADGLSDNPDLELRMDVPSLQKWLTRAQTPAQIVETQNLEFNGERSDLEKFSAAFVIES